MEKKPACPRGLAAVLVALAVAAGAWLLRRRRRRKGPRHDPFGAFLAPVDIPAAPAPAAPLAPLPLAGLTFAVKDIFDVAGTVTGFGSPDWARTHERAAASAPAVTLLTAAGARGVAKTVMDEMAFSLLGENAHYGTPKVRAGGGALGVPPLNLPDTSSKEGTAKQGQGPRFCPHLSYVVSREGARAVWGGGQREGGQAQPSRPLSGVSSMHFSSFALFDGLPSG